MSGSGLVAPILIDVPTTEIAGPMTSLQSIAFTESDMRKMVLDVNKAQASRIDESVLNDLFNAFWPGFSAKVEELRSEYSQGASLKKVFDQEKTLTEILGVVRGLQRAESEELQIPSKRALEARNEAAHAYTDVARADAQVRQLQELLTHATAQLPALRASNAELEARTSRVQSPIDAGDH